MQRGALAELRAQVEELVDVGRDVGLVRRGALDGENVHEHAETLHAVVALDEGRAGVADLGEGQGEVRVGIVVLRDGMGIDAVEGLDEAVIVRARHHQVDVVVPGDEALVADGAEHGAAGEGIGNAFAGAEFVDAVQQFELDLTHFIEIEGAAHQRLRMCSFSSEEEMPSVRGRRTTCLPWASHQATARRKPSWDWSPPATKMSKGTCSTILSTSW